MTVQVRYLDQERLHLQHGPIDLILAAHDAADERKAAYDAALKRFETVLSEIVEELSILRLPVHRDTPNPAGETSKRMVNAVRPFFAHFVTPMAAVAGSVADTVLAAMTATAPLTRGYVNNGGDIAIHLSDGAQFELAMKDHQAGDLGRITITSEQAPRGIATSGRHGRSHSIGIADSVTVLAPTAAMADAAATLIANAVDLPGHKAIRRCPASEISDNTDLGDRLVVTGLGHLSQSETATALEGGFRQASALQNAGLISAVALFLNGQACSLGPNIATNQRSLTNA